MSLTIMVNVHQCEDVVFDDLAALNTDLTNTYVSELLENYPNLDFIRLTNGKIAFLTQEGGYASEYIEVWGCFYEDEMKVVARHIASGKLVLRFDIEGRADEYFVLTPNKVEKKVIKF